MCAMSYLFCSVTLKRKGDILSYFNPTRQTVQPQIEDARVQTQSITGEVHLETENPGGQIEADERTERSSSGKESDSAEKEDEEDTASTSTSQCERQPKGNPPTSKSTASAGLFLKECLFLLGNCCSDRFVELSIGIPYVFFYYFI